MKVLFVGESYRNGALTNEAVAAVGAARLGLEVYFSGACEGLCGFGIKPACDDFSDFRLAFFTGEHIGENAHRIAGIIRENGGEAVFDPDGVSESTKAAANAFAESTDYFLPSLADAEIMCGLSDPEKTAELYLQRGTKKVVVTLGKHGAYFKSRVESGYAPTFRADKIIDEIGTGGGFAAGLISGICEELPLSEACVRANAMGSIQLQTAGALDGLPDMKALREFMLDHRFKLTIDN